MPAVHAIKNYVPNRFYHIYNRGSRKMKICHDTQDFRVFHRIAFKLEREMADEITIHSYAILYNHYHFLIHQTKIRSITRFMKSLAIRYTSYYRKKYKEHSGTIFQGVFKARLIHGQKDYNLIHQYILDNPLQAGLEKWEFVG